MWSFGDDFCYFLLLFPQCNSLIDTFREVMYGLKSAQFHLLQHSLDRPFFYYLSLVLFIIFLLLLHVLHVFISQIRENLRLFSLSSSGLNEKLFSSFFFNLTFFSFAGLWHHLQKKFLLFFLFLEMIRLARLETKASFVCSCPAPFPCIPLSVCLIVGNGHVVYLKTESNAITVSARGAAYPLSGRGSGT